MNRRLQMSRAAFALFAALALTIPGLGLNCPGGGAPLDPPLTDENRAPRMLITEVITPSGDGNAEQGDIIQVNFTAEDTDDRAFVRIFASDSNNPGPGSTQIPILNNFPIGPGSGGGQAFWRTVDVVPGSYFIYGEIDDRTFDAVTGTGNPPVLVAFTSPVLIAPKGTGPENAPPEVTVQLPASDGGFTNGDVLTVRYTVGDPNSNVDNLTVTWYFDLDRNASNDATQPPLVMGTTAITSNTIVPGQFLQQTQEVPIDLNEIPVRRETDEGGRPLPYNVRVRVEDGVGGVVDAYAPGTVRILRLPDDVVDIQQVGGSVAGAIWQGFDGAPDDPARGSRAGAVFAPLGDMDLDGLADFAIGAETASPFGQPRTGEVYVIYGRERRLNLDLAQVLPFSSGRYAGVNSLNTVGSFVSFPPTDPRFQTIFNIRGSIIPQLASLGTSLGVTSLASIEDMTIFNPDNRRLPLTRELLVGWPYGVSMADQEDDDPCDTCTYDEDQRAPFPCLSNPQPRFGNNAMDADVDFVSDNFPANTWQPFDPANPIPFFAPNVDLQLDDARVTSFASLLIQVEGQVPEGADQNVTIDFRIEDENGPSLTLNIGPANFTDDQSFNATAIFPVADLTLPAIEGQSLPPSAYDGRFLVMLRPSAAVESMQVTVVAQGFVSTPGEATEIKTIFDDGFPNAFPDMVQSTDAGVNSRALADLGVVCPPLNRTEDPLSLSGLGNRDGHFCGTANAISVGCAGPDSGTFGDNVSDGLYESGLVFVDAGDDLVMRLFTGVDANNDGIPDDGPAGVWRGDGFRVALQDFFGQPRYIRQGGLGMIGARFRGAWWQPQGIYDPENLFGYTVDSMPDMNAFGFTDTELITSSPNGGFLISFAEDLTGSLAGTYSNDPNDAGAVVTATGSVDLGVSFNNVTGISLVVSGSAMNGAVLQAGLDNGAGGFVLGTVREALLWNGASPPDEMDGVPQLNYGDLIGDQAFFFNIELVLPRASWQANRNGTSAVRIAIRQDCAVQFSSFQLDSVEFRLNGLLGGAGYVHLFEGNDYTSNQIEPIECGIVTNGDPESDENRPMSWPSFNCPDGAVDVRTLCGPDLVSTITGERFGDALGFAHYAGDVNLDGVPDIIMGAPGSDNDPFTTDLNCIFANEPNPLNNNGKVYLLYGTPTLASGQPCDIPERLEVRGSHNDDQFGRVQGRAGDVNGDGAADVFIGSESYDVDSQLGQAGVRADAGLVGILFGRVIDQNAAQSIRPEAIGTQNFPGVKFIGGVAGARLGGGTPGNTNFFANQRGQHGVSSAGDFNRDGFEDLLITAPGQPWPSVKIEFFGNVADGDKITINSGVAPTVLEFDFNGSVAAGSTAVPLTAADPLSAQQALVSALTILPTESAGISAITSRTNFPFPIPDTPTVTFLRRAYSPATNWVTSSTGNVVVTDVVRQGVAYLVFGSNSLLHNKTFSLPQDINRRDINGNRVLKGMIFVAAFEKNSGGNDATPDEAPIEAVSSVGDIDGDGFVDIILGAPQADLINVIAPNERRQSAGEAYLIYGNEFGFNKGSLP